MNENAKPSGETVLFMTGGEITPLTTRFLFELMKSVEMRKTFKEIKIGFNSFKCLLMPQKWIKTLTDEEWHMGYMAKSSYIGTSETIDFLDNPEKIETAIKNCQALDIKWIFIAGDDECARNMSEICGKFYEKGISLAFVMPLAITGITGGDSFGLRPAVNAIVSKIENIVSNVNKKDRPCLAVEIPGKSSDYLLINTLMKLDNRKIIGDISMDDINILAIPATFEWSLEKLKKRISTSSKIQNDKAITLIIMSEGSTTLNIERKRIKFTKNDIKKIANVQTEVYSLQQSCCADEICQIKDFEEVYRVANRMADAIAKAVSNETKNFYKDQPFTIVTNSLYKEELSLIVKGPHYFAERNPRFKGIVSANKKKRGEDILLKYLP